MRIGPDRIPFGPPMALEDGHYKAISLSVDVKLTSSQDRKSELAAKIRMMVTQMNPQQC